MTRIIIGIACIAIAAVFAGSLSGCATAPTANQVQDITIACAADSAARPAAQIAVAATGNPAYVAGLTALEAGIDQVCANPAASAQANALALLNANIGKVAQIVANANAAKHGEPAPFPNVLAAPAK